MSASNKGQRFFIIFIVVIFFLTSLGASGFVLYDALRNKDDQNVTANQQDVQQQLEDLQNQQGDKLEGTKLEGFEPVSEVKSLQKIDTKVGEGAEAKAGSTITAHYTGALAKDGTIFQSSKDTGQPFTSPLSGLIPGWKEGIPGMKVGGVRRLLIPAEQAYGAQATGNIPANSDLVFDIELVEVK